MTEEFALWGSGFYLFHYFTYLIRLKEHVYVHMTTKEKFFAFGLALLVLVLMNVVLYPYLGKREPVEEGLVVSCPPRESVQGERLVVLRVDDVQAYAWSETSMRMIEDAEKEGIPLTLGVIPAGLLSDGTLVSFLKKRPCTHEFALHGWNHGEGESGNTPEFGELTKDEARARIIPGMETLSHLTLEPVVTWIPPLNVHSKGTDDALHELGFTYLSTEGKGVYDYDSATFRYGTNVLVGPEMVMEECENAFQVDGHCIVMIHPQDFTDGPVHNETKYKTYYLDLIEAFKAQNVTFVRMRDLGM